MATLSYQDLFNLAVAHGFPDPDTAAAVAMAESGGNPNARGDVTIGGSLGLWQVYLSAHQEYAVAPDPDGTLGTNALYDPDTNADAAFKISSGGTVWTPWSTYNSGAYKQYLTGQSASALQKLFAPVLSLPTPVKIVAGAVAVAGGLALAFPRALRAVFAG